MPDDAGLATARRVASRHPNIPAKFLSTGGQPDYINDKVISLEKMAAAAAHEIFVISDSDVRVTPDYLRAVALPFADQRVGGMCCLYRGVAVEGGLWARLEAVGMSVEMSSGVLAARAMEGMQFTLGPTMAFRRETIRRMGGFRVTADYCADDFVLGNETHKLGQTVVTQPPRHRPHGSAFEFRRLAQAPDSLDEVHALLAAQRPLRHSAHLQRALRPARARRAQSGSAIPSGASRCSLGPSPRASRSPSPSAAVSSATQAGSACSCSIPIRDFMGFCFWAASYAGNRILWRGRVFELLPGGKMRAAK